MQVAIVGTGYVGLVSGTCFADSGNDVTCVDNNAAKIENLKRGEIPIYEPGLAEMVEHNVEAGRLHFTTDLPGALKGAELVFLAVGTPQNEQTGEADLTALKAVVREMAPALEPQTVVVTKSTVPVGTNAEIRAMLKELTKRDCDVASNPEFLKEGAAIDDFQKPDRVVVGVTSQAAGDKLRTLYEPFLRNANPFIVMSPESAEMTKYVANTFLATKISFMNEVANLCELLRADIDDVHRGVCSDSRIGKQFMYAGVGYGGSCFPKDVRALIHTAKKAGYELRIAPIVDSINAVQQKVLLAKMLSHFQNDLAGKTIAVWGLAFKPKTDDIREAPALAMIRELLDRGAKVRAYDPEAVPNVRKEKDIGEKVSYTERAYDALTDADALLTMTEWPEFRTVNLATVKKLLRKPTVFDGRNIFDPQKMRTAGFTYYSIGRASVVN